MAKQTRRGFLHGVASAGMLTAVPALVAACAQPDGSTQQSDVLSTTSQQDVRISGPVVIHVRDLTKGELTVLVDTREFVYRDPEFVTRLVKAVG